MHFVYILRCNNNRLYAGCTNDIKNRISEHVNGYVKATKNFRPIKLIFFCCFPNKYLSFNFEKYLKSDSDRTFISKRFIKNTQLN